MAFLPAFGLKLIAEKVFSGTRDEKTRPPSNPLKGTLVIALCLILSAGGTIHLISDIPTRISHYAGYYLVCTPRDYDTSLFAQMKTAPRSNILAAYPADPWISIITGKDTSSADVESTNFYMGNSIIGIEETNPYNTGRNPSLYLEIDEESYEALRLKDTNLKIDFVATDSDRHSTDPSEAKIQKVEWLKRSAESIILGYKFENRFYILEKTITIKNTSSLVEFKYRIIPKIFLSNLNITCGMILNRELKYYSLFIPEFFPWLNPWDRPTVKDDKGRFAYVSFPFHEIPDRFFALFDEDKDALIAVRLGTDPQEMTIGARSDRRIDTVKATYRYNSVSRGERIDFSFDILGASLPKDSVLDDIHKEFIISMIQKETLTHLESQDYIGVVELTPATHIQGRQNRLPTGYLFDPRFNKIFDNGLSNLYAFYRT
jgi:hypothetical protein